jgi:hypothetical protein
MWVAYHTRADHHDLTGDLPSHAVCPPLSQSTVSAESLSLSTGIEEGRWALPHGEFGLDVIALVGMLRYTSHRSIPAHPPGAL